MNFHLQSNGMFYLTNRLELNRIELDQIQISKYRINQTLLSKVFFSCYAMYLFMYFLSLHFAVVNKRSNYILLCFSFSSEGGCHTVHTAYCTYNELNR